MQYYKAQRKQTLNEVDRRSGSMDEILEFCKKWGISKDIFYGREKVMYRLDLHRVTSIPEGFSPDVRGDLWLYNVTGLSEGFNPTVGGDLRLDSVTVLPEDFNITVGGDLHLHSGNSMTSTTSTVSTDSVISIGDEVFVLVE